MEMDKLGMITQRTTEISSGGESVSQAIPALSSSSF